MANSGETTNRRSLFDTALLKQRQHRFARQFAAHDFLHRECASRLWNRLADINRVFASVATLGDSGGYLERDSQGKVPGFARFTSYDPLAHDGGVENVLPPSACDLLLSNLALHYVDDLPSLLNDIRQSLRPEGLFLGVLLGGESFVELRQSLLAAEMAVTGGASPRLHPVIDIYDMTRLMQGAGFVMPVVDRERLTIDYGDFGTLLADLRVHGGNVLRARHRRPSSRAFWAAAAAYYEQIFKEFPGRDSPGRLPVTLDLIFVAGWGAGTRP